MARKQSEHEHLYKPPVSVVVFHQEDRELDTITIRLPSPPPLHKIDGFGLHPSEQKFTRDQIPPRLAALNKKRYEDSLDYWADIADDWDYYKEEMKYIDLQWERRKNGYWFYNNGVPTWITGHHYMHLRWFEAENKGKERNKYQDYRDRDRRFYTALWWCKNTTEAFFKFKITKPDGSEFCTSSDKKYNEAEKNKWKIERGGHVIDMGRRTVIGMTWNKMRREGASTKACNINLDIATRTINGNNGIQSATEDAAEKIFKKILLRGWRGYPFFFKPVNENNPDPSKALRFKPQSKKGKKGDKAEMKSALYSQITYKASTENAYDGEQIDFMHTDEPGKTSEVNVERRHMKFVKQTLTLGANRDIHGLHLCTTTVGDMVKDGGEHWKKLCAGSHYRDRNDAGQTQTGLVNFFIDSADGLEGFIDEFGNSKFSEAEAHINTQIEQFIANDDEEGLVDFKKDVPRNFRDCFSVLTGNKRFPMQKINERLNEFLFSDNENLVYAKLTYTNWPKWDGLPREQRYLIENLPKADDFMLRGVRVKIEICDKTDYDWEFSYMPDSSEANQWYRDIKGMIHPANSAIWSQGADMFKIGEDTTSGKSSNGAGAIYRKYNPGVDSPERNRNERIPETPNLFYHKTGVFNAIYNKVPPSTDEFCEQQLMASILFGCKCFPEINLTDVWKWYSRRGFINYLQFRIDVKTGKELKQPGFHTGGETRNSLFNVMRDYLEMSALIENHIILLKQCSDIDLKMNDYDVFTACGFALLGASEIYKNFEKIPVRDISFLFKRKTI